MITVEAWTTIRYLHAQGKSIRAIARQLGVSRNTVRAALRRNAPAQYVRPKRPNPKIEPFTAEIEKMIHVHHAGNSSGIVDGAAAILIGSKAFGKKAGLKPRARIRSFASIGSEPAIMLTGPAPASEKALKRAKMDVKDIDLFELNEAFAAVVLRYMQILKMPHDKMNVNGGSIAMGHPLGATGAMILGTLLDELERRNLSTGLATLCVGGGMGTATIIERV